MPEGEVVGAATIIVGTPAVLDVIFVHPRQRRRRIGYELAERALLRLIESGHTPVHCEIAEPDAERMLDKLPAHINAQLQRH
jgi:hypothetical protein